MGEVGGMSLFGGSEVADMLPFSVDHDLGRPFLAPFAPAGPRKVSAGISSSRFANGKRAFSPRLSACNAALSSQSDLQATFRRMNKADPRRRPAAIANRGLVDLFTCLLAVRSPFLTALRISNFLSMCWTERRFPAGNQITKFIFGMWTPPRECLFSPGFFGIFLPCVRNTQAFSCLFCDWRPWQYPFAAYGHVISTWGAAIKFRNKLHLFLHGLFPSVYHGKGFDRKSISAMLANGHPKKAVFNSAFGRLIRVPNVRLPTELNKIACNPYITLAVFGVGNAIDRPHQRAYHTLSHSHVLLRQALVRSGFALPVRSRFADCAF